MTIREVAPLLGSGADLSEEERSWSKLGQMTFVMLFCTLTARAGLLIWAGADRIVSIVPDDAMYYLVLAKNHALLGRWTFDGVAPATGFHLMWGYILSLLYYCAPKASFEQVFLFAATLGAICIATAAAMMTVTAARYWGHAGVFGVWIVFSNPLVLQQSTNMMESMLVIVFSAALWFFIFQPRTKLSFADVGLIGSVGFLGMMARSDFGLQSLVVFVVAVLGFVRNQSQAVTALRAAAALIGSLLGLTFVLGHNYLTAGHPIPASALIKRHWSMIEGAAVTPGLRLIARLVVPYEVFLSPERLIVSVAICAPVGLVIVLGLWKQRWLVKASANQMMLLGAGSLIVVGYLVFYAFDGAIQNWYCSVFVAATSILIAAVLLPFGESRGRAMAAITILVAGIGLLGSVVPTWPWQKATRDAGLFLRAHPQINPVGAWNAGYVSYFSGRPVVNLDGLVNDDLLDVVNSGKLADYIASRKIAYLVDFPTIFPLPSAIRGNDYWDARMISCVNLEKKLAEDRPDNMFQGTTISLFKVDLGCLDHARPAQGPSAASR